MAENPKLPLMVHSFMGHLDLQVAQDPARLLTGEQVTTYNWLLEQARRSSPRTGVQFIPPIADGEARTVANLSVCLAALAEALGV